MAADRRAQFRAQIGRTSVRQPRSLASVFQALLTPSAPIAQRTSAFAAGGGASPNLGRRQGRGAPAVAFYRPHVGRFLLAGIKARNHVRTPAHAAPSAPDARQSRQARDPSRARAGAVPEPARAARLSEWLRA